MIILSSFLSSLWENLINIFESFTFDKSLLWMIIPIFSLWLILEIYFGMYKREDLGWNTALGNGISLLWVVLPAIRNIFSGAVSKGNLFLVFFALFYSIFIIFFSFTHKIKDKILFRLSDPSPIYFLSLIVILWSYIPNLPFNLYVLIDLIILFTLSVLLFALLRKSIKPREIDHNDSLDNGFEDREFSNFDFGNDSFENSFDQPHKNDVFQNDFLEQNNSGSYSNNDQNSFGGNSDPFGYEEFDTNPVDSQYGDSSSISLNKRENNQKVYNNSSGSFSNYNVGMNNNNNNNNNNRKNYYNNGNYVQNSNFNEPLKNKNFNRNLNNLSTASKNRRNDFYRSPYTGRIVRKNASDIYKANEKSFLDEFKDNLKRKK